MRTTVRIMNSLLSMVPSPSSISNIFINSISSSVTPATIFSNMDLSSGASISKLNTNPVANKTHHTTAHRRRNRHRNTNMNFHVAGMGAVAVAVAEEGHGHLYPRHEVALLTNTLTQRNGHQRHSNCRIQ